MDEVQYVFTQVGSPAEAAQYGCVGSPTEATFSILLHDKKDTEKLLKEMEKKKDQYPDAKLEVIAASFMMGGASTNITIDVIGENIADLEKVANAIKER